MMEVVIGVLALSDVTFKCKCRYAYLKYMCVRKTLPPCFTTYTFSLCHIGKNHDKPIFCQRCSLFAVCGWDMWMCKADDYQCCNESEYSQLFTSWRAQALAAHQKKKKRLTWAALYFINVLQQVCLQIVFPPATCCLWGSLQSLILNWCSSSLAHCLHISTCQKTSSIHLSAAEDNTRRRSWCPLINSQFSAGQKERKEDRVSTPLSPRALMPEPNVIPHCTTRLESEEGFHLCCFKNDATKLSNICSSLK